MLNGNFRGWSSFKTLQPVTTGRVTSYRAMVIALVSLCCWTGVIVGGRLITFYRPPYFWCFWCG